MIEAAIMNRMKRHISLEESIRRFLRAANGGELLLRAVNMGSARIEMEMKRVQIVRMLVFNKAAALRQTGWRENQGALRAAWLAVWPGLCCTGQFRASVSTSLYIQAAHKWAVHNEEAIVRMGTEGKRRINAVDVKININSVQKALRRMQIWYDHSLVQVTDVQVTNADDASFTITPKSHREKPQAMT